MMHTTHWEFLPLDEVAAILRIGNRTVHELARTGRLDGPSRGVRSLGWARAAMPRAAPNDIATACTIERPVERQRVRVPSWRPW
jgi:hypothetical protein